MRRCLCCSRWPNLVVWGWFRDGKKRNRDLVKGRKKASWKNSWNWESTTSALRKIYSFREREEILAAFFFARKGKGKWLVALGFWILGASFSWFRRQSNCQGGERKRKKRKRTCTGFPESLSKKFPSFFLSSSGVTPMAALWSEVKVDFEVGVIPNLIYIISSFPLLPLRYGKINFLSGEVEKERGEKFFSPNESSRRGRQIFFSRSPKEFFEFMKNRKGKTIDPQSGRFRVTNRAALIHFWFLPFLFFFLPGETDATKLLFSTRSEVPHCIFRKTYAEEEDQKKNSSHFPAFQKWKRRKVFYFFSSFPFKVLFSFSTCGKPHTYTGILF